MTGGGGIHLTVPVGWGLTGTHDLCWHSWPRSLLVQTFCTWTAHRLEKQPEFESRHHEVETIASFHLWACNRS